MSEDLEAFVDDGAPPIVIAFGSMSGSTDDTVGAAISQMLEAGRRVVVQGDAGRSLASPNLVHTGRVDHRALFPRASLVIHHGGAGTTHAACAAGVPSVVVPHVGDQRYWGERLHRLGVAPKPLLARGLDGRALADAALAAAADPALRAAAEGLAASVAAENGVAAAVAAIESHVH